MDTPTQAIRTWLGSGSIDIFGKPFSGKDTQGHLLAELFDGVALSSGQILRESVDRIPRRVTDLMHAGKLIPTEDFVAIVLPYLHQAAFTGKPLILSSVGRWHGEEEGVLTATKAAGHPIKAVIYLKLDDADVRARWHALKDLSDRGDRHDDTLEVLDIRFAEYQEKTLPVIEYYREKGLLIEIDGNQSPEDVSSSIISGLGEMASRNG